MRDVPFMSTMLRIVVFLFGFLALWRNEVDAVRCFECTHYPSPSLCLDVTTCSTDEDCYVEEIVTTGGRVVYNSGCITPNRCSALNTPLIGKRSSDMTTCKVCCNGDLCNNEGCSKTAPSRDERGPYCYSCDLMSRPDDCDKLSICDRDEQCVIYTPAEFQSNPDQVYRAECESIDACRSLPGTGGACPAACCETDFCNDRCVNTTTATTTTATTTLILVPTTPSPTTSTASTTTSTTATTTSTPVPTTPSRTTSTASTTTTSPTTSTASTTTSPTTSTASTTTSPTTSTASTTTTPTTSTASTTTSPTTSHRPSGDHCPSHFHRVGHTDLCIKINQDKQSWDHARKDCQNAGGDLLVYKTDREREKLVSYLHDHHNHHVDDYWIGLIDENGNDHYQFVNGDQVSNAMWIHGQPDDTSERCVRAVYQRGLRWSDHNCRDDHGYICQSQLIHVKQ